MQNFAILSLFVTHVLAVKHDFLLLPQLFNNSKPVVSLKVDCYLQQSDICTGICQNFHYRQIQKDGVIDKLIRSNTRVFVVRSDYGVDDGFQANKNVLVPHSDGTQYDFSISKSMEQPIYISINMSYNQEMKCDYKLVEINLTGKLMEFINFRL